ncbi:MAG: ParB/RepB/Spo0J family partition protein [Vicinamibacteria bacterium]|nr:ParB/RepB/Spo0J family partition protein [Vicinamibacteria bacterium]
MKRKALGKGLQALLPEPEPITRSGEVQKVDVDLLDPNPYQPRTTVDASQLTELASSIRESGIIQPLLVRPLGTRYQIVAGERRWRAAKHLGLPAVPVVLREIPDESLLELALVENIQRKELTPLEEAWAFRRLQEEFHITQEEVARKVGRDRSTVANILRLLRLPKEVQNLLSSGKIDMGHARAILAVERAQDQTSLAQEAARRGLSVREIERRVALLRAPKKRPKATKDANTRAAEEKLRMALGTRIEIARRGHGGLVRIIFKNEAELNRLFEILTRAGRGRA